LTTLDFFRRFKHFNTSTLQLFNASTLQRFHDLLFPRRRHPGMARASGEATLTRLLATDFAIVAGVNEKARVERAVARK
jgi:hypothetical protein